MTDLVERLRVVPSAGQFLRLGDLVNFLVEERKEAAAELEKLRAEVEKLKKNSANASWETDRLRTEGAYDTGRDGWL